MTAGFAIEGKAADGTRATLSLTLPFFYTYLNLQANHTLHTSCPA
jgi:hypothetical protein